MKLSAAVETSTEETANEQMVLEDSAEELEKPQIETEMDVVDKETIDDNDDDEQQQDEEEAAPSRMAEQEQGKEGSDKDGTATCRRDMNRVL